MFHFTTATVTVWDGSRMILVRGVSTPAKRHPMEILKNFFVGLGLFVKDISPFLIFMAGIVFVWVFPENIVNVVMFIAVGFAVLFLIGLGVYCAYDRGKKYRAGRKDLL
jgi:hypothetical protein